MELNKCLNSYLSGTVDYCDFEEAIFACGPGEVIVLNKALYGRMKKGRCISLAINGTMECSENILDIVDTLCSGKQTCSIEVDERSLARNTGCHKELKKYLEAGYVCVQGEAHQF